MDMEAESLRGSFEMETEKLASDLEAMVNRADRVLKELGASGLQASADSRNTIGAKISEARAGLLGARAALVGRARGATEAGGTFVRENPWTSLGAVALVGIVVGILLDRR